MIRPPGDRSLVTKIRIARPTDCRVEVTRFYRGALGLEQIGSFRGHAGDDGVMLALPGRGDHLEFTAHAGGRPCPAPTGDNLLVFSVPDAATIRAMVARLGRHGREPVTPENPYGAAHGFTFADPDRWRVVLMNTSGIETPARSGEPREVRAAAGVAPEHRRTAPQGPSDERVLAVPATSDRRPSSSVQRPASNEH